MFAKLDHLFGQFEPWWVIVLHTLAICLAMLCGLVASFTMLGHLFGQFEPGWVTFLAMCKLFNHVVYFVGNVYNVGSFVWAI